MSSKTLITEQTKLEDLLFSADTSLHLNRFLLSLFLVLLPLLRLSEPFFQRCCVSLGLFLDIFTASDESRERSRITLESFQLMRCSCKDLLSSDRRVSQEIAMKRSRGRTNEFRN